MEPVLPRIARLLAGRLTPAPPVTHTPETGVRAAITPIALVLGNLIPLAGVLVWGWDVASLVIFYWSENLVIGAFTILKMLIRNPAGGLFTSAFFAFHYGGFCAGHGLFLMTFFDLDVDGILGELHWPFAFVFVEMLVNVIRRVIAVAPPEWLWGFAALVASHGVSFVANYLWRGEYRSASLAQLMTAPYSRIVLLHVAVIVGGFGVMALGSPLPILIILVIGKIAIDLSLHVKEHGFQVPRRRAARPARM